MSAAVAGLVLAGGRSRRMGGAEKALMPLAGRPLLAHVAARLAPQVGALALAANGDRSRFAPFGLPVLPDAVPDFAGPLAGILAGLRWAAAIGAARLATAPCDTPFLPADLVARLEMAAGAGVAVAASNGRPHHVCALWPAALAAPLADFLAAGGDRSVHGFLAGVEVAVADFPLAGGRDPFLNLNTPDDFAAAGAAIGDGIASAGPDVENPSEDQVPRWSRDRKGKE